MVADVVWITPGLLIMAALLCFGIAGSAVLFLCAKGTRQRLSFDLWRAAWVGIVVLVLTGVALLLTALQVERDVKAIILVLLGILLSGAIQ